MRIVLKLTGAKERTQRAIDRLKTRTPYCAVDNAARALAQRGLLNASLPVLPIRGNFGALVMNITRGDLRMLYAERWLSYEELAGLLGVKKAKIERWLKPGKPDDTVLPISRLDFWAAEDNAPAFGARFYRLLAHKG